MVYTKRERGIGSWRKSEREGERDRERHGLLYHRENECWSPMKVIVRPICLSTP